MFEFVTFLLDRIQQILPTLTKQKDSRRQSKLALQMFELYRATTHLCVNGWSIIQQLEDGKAPYNNHVYQQQIALRRIASSLEELSLALAVVVGGDVTKLRKFLNAKWGVVTWLSQAIFLFEPGQIEEFYSRDESLDSWRWAAQALADGTPYLIPHGSDEQVASLVSPQMLVLAKEQLAQISIINENIRNALLATFSLADIVSEISKDPR